MMISRHDVLRPEQNHLLGHDERTPAHRHRHGHVVYPASGVLSLVTAAGLWIAPPNRAVWIPAGYDHEHRAHGATDMRIVFLTGQAASSLAPQPKVLVVTPLVREALLALTDGSDRAASMRTLLRAVIVEDALAAPEQPLHLPEPRDDRLRAAARIVEDDLSAPVGLDEVGRRVGASARTLSRLFHAETGMGYRQWRTQLRIHHALVMLAEGTPVLDVAFRCGWSSPSVFIAAFTTLVGQTPGGYQRDVHRPQAPG
ncbi:AraC family transcriptional regulator [Tomitella gaofuii]|uniref:AraC family transcriptional regulator n=1 Tax=Tomitella gaofuii TaxID=2760083 RepID=UPI0015F93E9C|nr:helix-turn-helix transcriptional regulator [Tomitella gaofuii]